MIRKYLGALFVVCVMSAAIPAPVFARTYEVPLLMYHAVVELGPATPLRHYSFFVAPKSFEAQLRYLQKQNYRTLFVKDIAALMRDGKKISPQTIALTFDDGRDDFVTTVLPLLKKYNMRATLYANPGFNGTHDRMKWEDIIIAHHSGLVEIAAHTMTHQKLSEISPDMARAEINDSKKILEHLIDAPVVSFAYPFGAQNETVKKMVADAGFTSAAISEKTCAQKSEALYTVPRVRVGDMKNIESFVKLVKH